MKKLFKILGIVVLLLVAIFFIMALTQPTDVTITRTTTINAPQAAVWNQVVYFKNWPNWSPWVAAEPTVKITYEGTDGTPGSNYKWLGDETGQGQMTNTKIEGGQMDFDLLFIKPWEGKSDGFIKTEDAGNNETRITWTMTSHGSFPFNALNFITDKVIGKDFEKGFELIEKYLLEHPNEIASKTTAYRDVQERTYPATLFATMRKTVSFSELSTYSQTSFPALAAIAKERITGPAASFYYTWDEQEQKTDMATAFPVSGTAALAGTKMVTVPASNSYYLVYQGGYSQMGAAHEYLGKHVEEKGKKLNFVLEEYLVGPATEADSNKWVTNINYITD